MWIKYWPQALLAVLLAAAMWYAHHRGFQTAFGRQQAVIAQIKAEQQAQALAAEQAYTAKLAEVQKLAQARPLSAAMCRNWKTRTRLGVSGFGQAWMPACAGMTEKKNDGVS